MLKRLFDFFLSIVGIILISPFLIVVSTLIKMNDGGPIIYKGKRVGQYGKPFFIFKFRSMIVDADKTGVSSTSNDDDRITGIGKFLRKYKLDEMPQLFNVLFGQMSFVGPRPEVQKFVDMYTEEEKELLTLKPGITDWASLWNPDEGTVLAGSTDPDRDYLEKIRPGKIQYQLKYLHERSFLTDIKIIFDTFMLVVRKLLPASS